MTATAILPGESISTQETIDKTRERLDRVFDAQMANRFKIANTSRRERIRKLKAMLKWIYANRERIHEAHYADFKKPGSEVDMSEIFVVTTEIKHAIKHLRQWMKPEKVPTVLAYATTKAWIRYEPKGVVLIIAPWNFPFNLALGPVVSAVAAGNCIVLKPSELAPATATLMREMLEELFEENELAVFEGDKEVSTALLEKPFHHIFFTGSPAVGKVVARAAAENLASITLELGGKSPVIVDETANMSDTVANIAWGKFINSGQACIAPDYLFVHESRYDELVQQLRDKIKAFYGETESERKASPDFARIISPRHQERLAEMIQDAVGKGARVEIGGEAETSDKYIAPTVLTEVPDDSRVMQEEIFGPVLPVRKYTNLDSVLEHINEGEKPLALYIFSGSRKNQNYILNNTAAGTSCINETMLQFLHPNLPFGGVNNSGFGNSHGWYGFRAFSHERPVLKHNALSVLKLLYPPYTPFVKKLGELIVKLL